MSSQFAVPVEPVEAPTIVPQGPTPGRVNQSNPASSRATLRKKRTRRRRVLVLLLVIAAAGAYPTWRAVVGPTAATEAQLVTVTVSIGDIEDAVTAVGNLSASQQQVVRADAAGVVDAILVQIGDEVAAGDLIAGLSTIDLDATVQTAAAQVTNLEASLADKEAQMQLSQANLTRQEGLYQAQAIAESALQTARAQVVSATATLQSVRAQLLQAQVNLSTAERNLAAALIIAPIAGTIVTLPIEIGQSVSSGSEILTIADLSTMTVEVQVSEADVGRLSVGMPAYFTTLSNTGRSWTGTLLQILPTPEIANNVVMYNVLFNVSNEDGTLRLGMSTQAFFVIAAADNVVTVSVAALQPAGAGRATPGLEAVAEGGVERVGAVQTDVAEPAAGNETEPPVGAIARQQGQLPDGVDPAQLAARQANGAEGAGNGQRQAGAVAGQFGPGAAAGGGILGAGDSTATQFAVRVLISDGTTETRIVEIGARDRLNAEVLAGLEAGDEVVVGTRDPTATATAAAPAPGGLGGALGGFGGGGGRF